MARSRIYISKNVDLTNLLVSAIHFGQKVFKTLDF